MDQFGLPSILLPLTPATATGYRRRIATFFFLTPLSPSLLRVQKLGYLQRTNCSQTRTALHTARDKNTHTHTPVLAAKPAFKENPSHIETHLIFPCQFDCTGLVFSNIRDNLGYSASALLLGGGYFYLNFVFRSVCTQHLFGRSNFCNRPAGVS